MNHVNSFMVSVMRASSLGREPRRNLGKVRHLVVEHVVVGAEQQEPLVRVVLHHLCDDDELSRSGRLDDAGAVALPKHI